MTVLSSKPMKFIKSTIILFIVFFLPFKLNGKELTKPSQCIENHECDSLNEQQYQVVYICTGLYAYAYHSRQDCPGLGNCKGQIQYTLESTAVNSFGRVPCCKCWSQVAGRCRDDNPTARGGGGNGGGGGGGAGDAMAFLAVAVIVTSAAILSNDFYFEPTYSFHSINKSGEPSWSNPTISFRDLSGYSFGFRKTLNKSAFEYGVSYLNRQENINDGSGYNQTYYHNRWGIHLNYIHQITHYKIPSWMNLYIGPTVNYVDDWGYGAILCAQMNLMKRLKLDFRYEFTKQTNQIQAGLIFNYQKKYFWKKS